MAVINFMPKEDRVFVTVSHLLTSLMFAG